MIYSTRRFVVCLSLCHFVLVFFSPFSIAITSLGEERANLSAFRTFIRFMLVWICRFPLPLGVWEGLQFVIVALPGLFSYLLVVCLSLCHFVLVFFSPFSIAITSLGEERANLSAFRTFVRFVLVWICRFPLPLGVWEGLWFAIVALPGLFSYLFFCLLLFCCCVCFFFLFFFVVVGFFVCLFFFCCCFFLFCFFFFWFFFSVLLALRLPRLVKRELILVLFVRLFDLRLFGFCLLPLPFGV